MTNTTVSGNSTDRTGDGDTDDVLTQVSDLAFDARGYHMMY